MRYIVDNLPLERALPPVNIFPPWLHTLSSLAWYPEQDKRKKRPGKFQKAVLFQRSGRTE
jgi:hypothetical protein